MPYLNPGMNAQRNNITSALMNIARPSPQPNFPRPQMTPGAGLMPMATPTPPPGAPLPNSTLPASPLPQGPPSALPGMTPPALPLSSGIPPSSSVPGIGAAGPVSPINPPPLLGMGGATGGNLSFMPPRPTTATGY